MKAGFCSIDITPPPGVPIGGNVRDEFRSRGVHDPLKADIVALENEACAVVLIDLDWVAAEREIVRPIRSEISRVCAIPYENICISMTHTHSGPDVYPIVRNNKLSPATRSYVDRTTVDLAAGVNAAMASMKPVKLGWGKTAVSGVSFNRRVIMKDGTLKMNWELAAAPAEILADIERTEGPVDSELSVLKMCDDSGLLGVIVNFALHPAVLVGRDWLFSKDFIWGLEETLRQQYGESLFVYFANGAQGNINHIDIYNKEQRDDWEEARRIGDVLGRGVLDVLDGIHVADSETLTVAHRKQTLPLRRIDPAQLEKASALWSASGGIIPELHHGVPDEWYAGNVLDMSGRNDAAEEVDLQVIRVGNGVIATLPCELFVEYGVRLKRESGCEHTVLFGVTNECAGYIPTPEAIDRGGMEGRTCHFSRFAPEAGDMLVEALLDMITDAQTKATPTLWR